MNTHGGPGHNIPCDLYNEHVNRQFKEIIGSMGANFTEQWSTRAARCVTTLSSIAETFDQQTGIHPEATSHTTASNQDDVLSVASVIQSCDILNVRSGRNHSNFPHFAASPLNSLNRTDLESWIKQKIMEHNKLAFVSEVNEDINEDSDTSEDDGDTKKEHRHLGTLMRVE